MKEGEDSGQSINLGGRQERREEGGKRKAGRTKRREGRPSEGLGGWLSQESSRVPSGIALGRLANKHTCNTREGGRCYSTKLLCEGDQGFKAAGSLLALRLLSALISVTATALFHSEPAGRGPNGESTEQPAVQASSMAVASLPTTIDGGAIHESTTFPSLPPFRTLQGLSRCARAAKIPLRIHAASGERVQETPLLLLPRRIGEHLLPPLIPLPSSPSPAYFAVRWFRISAAPAFKQNSPSPSLQPASLPSFIVYTAAPFEKGSIDRVATAEPFSMLT